jgi:hypothetical protein
MSLDTWKKEFYPVDAYDVKEKDAIAHSLQKWIGLRAKNLLKHELWRDKREICYGDPICVSDSLDICSETCALCVQYYNELDGYSCNKCPLVKVLGRPCDQPKGVYSHFTMFMRAGDPEPMIRALRCALKLTTPKKKKA